MQNGEWKMENGKPAGRVSPLRATPCFECEKALVKLQHVAMSWHGTPFVAHCKTKGNGVDCVHLCAEIYKECGVFSEYRFPQYTIQGGHHCEKSKIIEWLKTSVHFEEVGRVSPLRAGESAAHAERCALPGDLILFNFAKSAWHIGILLNDDSFVHCVIRGGVMFSAIRDPRYAQTISAVYRPVAQ